MKKQKRTVPQQSERGSCSGDRLLSQIVEKSPIPTFVIDKEHKVTHWNKACENLTGISAKSVMGTNKQWLAFYAEERPVMADLVVENTIAQEASRYYGDACRKSDIAEGAYEAEGFYPDLGKNGRSLFLTAAPIKNKTGDIVGAVETLQDISARKLAEKKLLESERRYRAVLEACPDPVVVYDMDGRAFYVNPAFSDVFQWEPEEVLGQKLDYVPENSLSETNKMIEKVLAGESFSGIESQRYTKEKDLVDVSISAAIYRDRKGKPAGSVHLLRDMTRQKKLEAQVEQSENILRLQKDLERRNQKLGESHEKLSQAYGVIKKDLEAGAKIQSSLLPQASTRIYNVQFDSIFLPSSFVAGDIYNYFKLDEDWIGFYVLDVAGHGIPAALLSVTLSRALSPENSEDSLLKKFLPTPEPPYYRLINPAMVVAGLNKRFQADPDMMQYFTMIYGMLNTKDGQTTVTLAGHPPPIRVSSGIADPVGTGGYPVGMLSDVEYEEERFRLDKGDRLFLFSDGITECLNNKGEQFSVERLTQLLEEGQHLLLHELIKKIRDRLIHWRASAEFADDMTVLALERL
jgi:sigma-B regulation protein RsbU (phosphoserine phosphatase)